MSTVGPAAGATGGGVAEVEITELAKAMTWWDGFLVALANPGFLIAALGQSIGALGTLGATVLWTISVCIGALQNNIYAEMATMFPNKSGGIALFAHEAWRRYVSFVGPLSTFGYWFAWSTVLSISGLVAGTLFQAQFFPQATWSLHAAHFTLTLPIVVAVAFLLFVWFFNSRGIRTTVAFTYVTGGLLLIPVFALMFLPYLTGEWHGGNIQWQVGANGGIPLALTWLYFMGWSSYGFEAVASFAPEYRDTNVDTPRALRTSAGFSVLVYALLPLGLGGTLGTKAVSGDATYIVFYKTAFDRIGGGGIGGFFVVCLICGIVLTMSTATADGSRALYGIAQDGMTIKEFGKLNKWGMPGRGMLLDAVMNIFLACFFGSALAILAAGNLGYMLAHFFALTGFLLLRRDRPKWPRAIRLSRIWLPIAGVLALANLAFVVCGAFLFANAHGYGLSKSWIGVGVLAIAILLYVYRRRVEDRLPVLLREETPTEPGEDELRHFAPVPVPTRA